MSPMIAALLLFQAQTAEDTFQKIEESVSRAKCARVRFQWEGMSGKEADCRVEASGCVVLKQGNKVHLAATITEKAQSSELKVVSDGTSVKTKLGAKRTLESPTPRNLEAGLRAALHRLGAMQAVLIAHKVCMMETGDQEEALDMGKKPPLSEFKPGPDDGDSKTLTYKITPDGPNSVAEVKLWYAPDTYRLVKRTITIRHPAESVFTEVYKDWILDGDGENDEFTLPAA